MQHTPSGTGLGMTTLGCFVVGSWVLAPAMPAYSEVMKVGERGQAPMPLVTVRPHLLNGRPAATLFVRDLPMLTFLGPTSRVTAGSKVANVQMTGDLLVPATQLASRLNDLTQQRWEAEALQVVQTEPQQLWLQYKDERLLRFDAQVTFDGATRDPVQNALQITNRLRLRLGNAPPLMAVTPATVAPSLVQRVMTAVGSVHSVLRGWASWYGPGFQGQRTASGEPFNPRALTAAHRTLPFGTRVRVTNLRNGQTVVVRINDRGPHVPGREIDLSARAAQALGLIPMGAAPVRLEVLGP